MILQAAIEYLQDALDFPVNQDEGRVFRQALALLGAAEKVDKEMALKELATVPSSWRPSPTFLGMSREINSQLRALLEALPSGKENV